MTAALMYVTGVVLFFLLLHFIRGRHSELWRRSVPRHRVREPSEAQGIRGKVPPAPPMLHEAVESEEREGVPHW